jgi:PAS domain S-box-containing protein
MGFFVARALTDRDARRDSERRAEVAAAQILGRLEQATSLTQSLRLYMSEAGPTGVTSGQFARNALRWLSPADFPAAAWAEQVQAGDRTAYERRSGQPIVTPDERNRRAPSSSFYLPATLVSGVAPLGLRGVDLRREPGIAAALLRASSPSTVAATPITRTRSRPSGLFLVAPGANLIDGVLRPGGVLLFVPEAILRAAAGNPPGLRLMSAGGSSGTVAGGSTVRKGFSVARRGFVVVMPTESLSEPAAALPWLILAAGLVLSTLATGLGVNAWRRAKAQAEVDRIFNLSPDLIAVADFDGHFTRVNPALEQILGYSREEFLARPYLDRVHPDDRRETAAEAAEIARGRRALSFENRYRHKDGSYRVLEWTATPVLEDRLMYGVARDVTARRQAEAERERLAEEQAALRRVATVVARGGSRRRVFNAIADEVRRLIDADFIDMLRYEDDRIAVSVAGRGTADETFPVGARYELGGDNAASLVLRRGQPVRIDNYDRTATGRIAETARPIGIRSVVGAPLVVDDRLWGAVTIGTTGEKPLPPDAEARLGDFTELMATAIANTETRAELQGLADEQAALRRVATLVARDASPDRVLDSVTAELERLLVADAVAIGRYESGDEIAVVGRPIPEPQLILDGRRMNYQRHDILAVVRRTGRPVRLDDLGEASGGFVDVFRGRGSRALVGAPIVVEGRLWGTIVVGWNREPPPSADTEERMTRFAELLGTALTNADIRKQLRASRARLVTAGDEARRRVVRDLHDGAQQRLVQTIVTLKLAQRAFSGGPEGGKAASLVGEALGQAERSNAELRELAHGILPSVLTDLGLRASVDSVVQRLDLPAEVEISDDRFPPEVEASAYFVIAEALTNVMKHSHATSAKVSASMNEGTLHIEVRDDGIGGADPDGHGLVGMKDRVSAFGGRLEVESPAAGGTLLSATLPLSAAFERDVDAPPL